MTTTLSYIWVENGQYISVIISLIQWLVIELMPVDLSRLTLSGTIIKTDWLRFIVLFHPFISSFQVLPFPKQAFCQMRKEQSSHLLGRFQIWRLSQVGSLPLWCFGLKLLKTTWLTYSDNQFNWSWHWSYRIFGRAVNCTNKKSSCLNPLCEGSTSRQVKASSMYPPLNWFAMKHSFPGSGVQ